MTHGLRILVAIALAMPAVPARAAPGSDITADIVAGRNVVLAGDAVVTLGGGTVTYPGVISGSGTLTVAGSGTLVLTRNSDFTIPAARQTEKVTERPYYTIADPDPPAVVVERGATLQYGTGGATGAIGHFPYHTTGFALNALNIRVDGTLRVNLTTRLHLGIMSGSGLIVQPRNTWPGLDLAGNHPFNGVLYNGTGVQFGAPEYASALPNAKKILNQGSFIVDTPLDQRTVVPADLYHREWGSDVNFHSRGTGVVVMTGVYSWADGGPDTDPVLSDPALNFTAKPHRANKRGVNIEGANVQWGDGTNHRFFLPGNRDTLYLNLHAARNRGRLSFDYDGPVTLGATISGPAPVASAGPVALAGRLTVLPGPAGGAALTIVDNTGTAPVQGTFDGLPEGATLAAAGTTYTISYHGGDGNDVVLTVVSQSIVDRSTFRWAPVAVVPGLALLVAAALLIRRRRRVHPDQGKPSHLGPADDGSASAS